MKKLRGRWINRYTKLRKEMENIITLCHQKLSKTQVGITNGYKVK